MPQTKSKPASKPPTQAQQAKDEAKLEKAYEKMDVEAGTPDVEATSKVTKAQKDQNKLAESNRDRWHNYEYTEAHAAVATDNGKGQVDVHAVAGKVYINTHGERTLDRDEVVTLRKALDEAWVTVQ